jgi:hypothetical protein
MDLYLAGGRLKEWNEIDKEDMDMYLAALSKKFPASDWREPMDFYIGAPNSEIRQIDMDLYLAGPNAGNITKGDRAECFTARRLYILESFYYMVDWMLPYIDNKVWNFMLDSGAFTFIKQKANGGDTWASTNWDDYVYRYADFILEHDINLFLELDIDVVVGLPRVEQLRQMLEARTGRQCIPVWHRSRGLDYWRRMVKDYQYIAIGGLAINVIHRNEYKYLNQLCDIAHETRTRVHGLGFTPIPGLIDYRFDSVDSTGWTMGNRTGHIMYFDGKTIQKQPKPDGMKMKAREAAKHNFREWVKYQRYMKHAGWGLAANGSTHDPAK